jgi:iron complex outermembrane recepter protein
MTDFTQRNSDARTGGSDKRRKMMLLVGGATGALASLIAPNAFAQSSSQENAADIVVTGTLIKGVAPVGASPVVVGKDLIEQSGAASANNLLASIPLLGTFNTVAATPVNLGNNTARPNLRGLSVGQYDPVTTLLMLDGHNMVGSGILQTSPDPTLLPTGAIERVEVVPDGGSSLYGSDAVAGVINFITRKRFDGTMVDAHAGYADQYQTFDVGITTGKNWDTGSFVFSAQTRQNNALYAEDRDFPRTNLAPFGGFDNTTVAGSRTCNSLTITAPGSRIYQRNAAGAFALTTTPVGCDSNIDGIIVPKEMQNSAFLSGTQEITSNITFDVNGYWSDRLSKRAERQITASGVTINNTNPFFQQQGTETTQTLQFSYAPVAGRRYQGFSDSTAYGFTPTLTFTLPGDWEAKALYNYGRSDVKFLLPQKNAAAELRALANQPGYGALTTTTALNPYNLAATNPAVLRDITNWATNSGNVQIMSQERATIGGPVFSLPGGKVRVLVGAQNGYESIDAFNGDAPPGVQTAVLRKAVHKTIKSAFAEILIPIIGPDNAFPLGQSLDLNLSGRYDDYSDFGVTRNPKVGFSYVPVEGITVHGNVGTSFNAPSLADTSGAVDTRIIITPLVAAGNINPNCNAPAVCNGVSNAASDTTLRPSISTPGGNPLLEPQTADTWAIGADFAPTFIPGLKFGMTYWDATLKKAIGTSNFAMNVKYATPEYARFYIMFPTLQQALDAFGGGNGSLPVTGGIDIPSLYTGPANTYPYFISSARRNNLGNQFVNGVDFNASFRQEVGFGALTARLNGTRIFHRGTQAFDGATKTTTSTVNSSRLSAQASLGAEIGKFTLNGTMNYTGGYLATGVFTGNTATLTNQRVKSFKPVNLFGKYDFDAENGFANGLSTTLSINNVFDINPPYLNSGGGTANGSTLGRTITAGISKRF